jgi:hypothetical protein
MPSPASIWGRPLISLSPGRSETKMALNEGPAQACSFQRFIAPGCVCAAATSRSLKSGESCRCHAAACGGGGPEPRDSLTMGKSLWFKDIRLNYVPFRTCIYYDRRLYRARSVCRHPDIRRLRLHVLLFLVPPDKLDGRAVAGAHDEAGPRPVSHDGTRRCRERDSWPCVGPWRARQPEKPLPQLSPQEPRFPAEAEARISFPPRRWSRS